MKLRIHILDLIKFDKLLESNEFLRKVLKEKQGEWLIETDEINEVKFFLEKAGVRHKIL